MDDTAISKRVGEPSILSAERAAEGQEAAADLRAALEANGIDPDSFDPDDLLELDPRDPEYEELYELMQQLGDEMYSEDFAAGFYDQMNTEGIRATRGVIEMFAAHQQVTPWNENPETRQEEQAQPHDFGNIQQTTTQPIEND